MLRAFQKSIAFLKLFASKCFILRREIRSISVGVQLILFPFTVLGDVYWTSKTDKVYRRFLLKKNFFWWDGIIGFFFCNNWLLQQCKFAQKVCNIDVCNNFFILEKFATFKKCQNFLQQFFATKMLQKLVFAT